MMRKTWIPLLSVAAVFATVSLASAGAYGEMDEPTELPAPPPPPAAPAPPPRKAPARPAPPVEINYGRTGAYLIGAGTYAFNSFDNPDAEHSLGGNGRVGYRLTENWAVEGQYDFFNDFAPDGSSIDNDGWAATLNTKYYPSPNRFSPFLLGGVGVLSLDGFSSSGGATGEGELGTESREEFVGKIGLGFDYYVTENIAVTGDLSYLIPAGDLEKFDIVPVSLGGMYRF